MSDGVRGIIAAADKIEARIVEAEKLRAALEEIRRLHAPMRAVCDECYGDGCQDLCTCGHTPAEHLLSYGMCAECLCYRFELDEDR